MNSIQTTWSHVTQKSMIFTQSMFWPLILSLVLVLIPFLVLVLVLLLAPVLLLVLVLGSLVFPGGLQAPVSLLFLGCFQPRSLPGEGLAPPAQ